MQRNAHRTLEIIGIGLFAVVFVLLSVETVQAGFENQISVGFLFVLLVLSVIASDFVSGFVHFLCDNFGSEQTPWLGPNLIKAFLDHHEKPQDIVAHDFVELLGNSCLASLPLLGGIYLFLPIEKSPACLYGSVFTLLFLFTLVLTNQFHKWAHDPNPPRLIRGLQELNLILSPTHHNQPSIRRKGSLWLK